MNSAETIRFETILTDLLVQTRQKVQANSMELQTVRTATDNITLAMPRHFRVKLSRSNLFLSALRFRFELSLSVLTQNSR